jgi:hypothetical protein
MAFGNKKRSLKAIKAATEATVRVTEKAAEESEIQAAENRRATETTSYRYMNDPEYKATVDERYGRIDAAIAQEEARQQLLDQEHQRSDGRLIKGTLIVLAVCVVGMLVLAAAGSPDGAYGTLCCVIPFVIGIPLAVLKERGESRTRDKKAAMKAARNAE